ncbi:MAG: YgfZ/GcvT domain-containing protein [Sphingomonadaceae bacterium]
MPGTTLADRAVLRVSAPRRGSGQEDDARGFLQGLVTNDVAAVGEIRPLWTGLLTPQGKTLFDFLLWADGEDMLIDCEAEGADDLVKRLALYRLRRPIEIARDDELAVHWSLTEGAVPDPRLDLLGNRWLGEPGEPARGWTERRLALGVCEGRAELGDILWLECNARELNGVAFDKGCFVGQENTARMHHRGKVNRRLVVVPLDRSDARRRRVAHPELGLAVEHRRVDDLGAAIVPEWLKHALA